MITHKLIESHPEDSDVKIVFIGTKEECDKERSKYFLSPLSTLELTDEEFDIARKLFKDNRKNEYICTELNLYNYKLFYNKRIKEFEKLLKFEYWDVGNKCWYYSYLITNDIRYSPNHTYDIFRIDFSHHVCATYLFANTKFCTVYCITTTDNSGNVFKFNSIEEYKKYIESLSTIKLK